MRPWLVLLLAVDLAGQPPKAVSAPRPSPIPTPLEQSRALQAAFLPLREQLREMLPQDSAQRTTPGATVEVIGTDETTALKLLSFRVLEQVRHEFHPMDTRGERELYAFIHQDPSHPASVLIFPPLAGAPVASPGDAWRR